MPDQISDLQTALSSHKSKLTTIEAISKTATHRMQQLLAISLQAFDKHLDSWATAAPMHKFIYTYDKHFNSDQEAS